MSLSRCCLMTVEVSSFISEISGETVAIIHVSRSHYYYGNDGVKKEEFKISKCSRLQKMWKRY